MSSVTLVWTGLSVHTAVCDWDYSYGDGTGTSQAGGAFPSRFCWTLDTPVCEGGLFHEEKGTMKPQGARERPP